MDERQAHLLRRAFLLGAITDALALIPMLIPSMASLLWGFTDASGPYQFAMGYGASLMLGWTMLLLWAYQRPIERSFVAVLTVFVIYGLVLTEMVAVVSGHLEAWRMIPTWCLQGALLFLFVSAYHYPAIKRWVAA
jgi:predicted neutral ceramidase superfamily lipid hydrolase